MAREGTAGRTDRACIERPRVESVRTAYGETLVELGEEREDIVVLDADLSASTQTCLFAERFPDRFFNMGISEADMMGTACGIALTGKTVFASTFAIFATGRAWDQIRNSIAYARANVKIVATHGGIVTGPDGASHQALEDISLMRVIPGMRIICPADAPMTRKVVRYVASVDGPFYVRLIRPKAPVIYDDDTPFEFGRAIKLREGRDLTIFTHGFMLWRCIKAAELLEEEGISVKLFDSHTIKPVDTEAIDEAIEETGRILVVEDHSRIGGLFSAIAEEVVRRKPVPMDVIAIDDVFGESGSIDELLEFHGLTPENIKNKAKKLLER